MSTPSVNIVLVHSAFSDASGWSKVIPTLQSAGHNVAAVQNALMSLTDASHPREIAALLLRACAGAVIAADAGRMPV